MEFQLGAHGHHRFYLSKNPVLHVPLLNVAGHIQNEHLTYLSSQALVTATWTCNQQPFNPQKIQFCTFSGKQNCRGKQQPRVPRLSRLPGNAKGQERKTWQRVVLSTWTEMWLKHGGRLQLAIHANMRMMQYVSKFDVREVLEWGSWVCHITQCKEGAAELDMHDWKWCRERKQSRRAKVYLESKQYVFYRKVKRVTFSRLLKSAI